MKKPGRALMITPILKFFFSILLIANAGLFAYQHGYLDALLPSNREPARMGNQLNADKIKLVPPSDTNPRGAPAATRTSPAASVPAATVQSNAGPRKPDTLACVEIGSFTRTQARRFSAALTPLSLGERVSQNSVQEVLTYMVYIPPLPDRDTAERITRELRQRGVDDYYVIRDNSSLNLAISLGVFNTEEAARQQLTNLNQKGVNTARIGQRSVSANAVVFRIRDLDVETRAALDKVKAAFPKQEMRACDTAP